MAGDLDGVARLIGQLGGLEREAKRILAQHELSPARTITLEASYKQLTDLSVDQDEVFREALRAVDAELFRAAHVLAWAGFIDYLHHHLAADLGKLQAQYPTWKLRGAEDFRDHGDYQVIEAGRVTGFYNKTMMKALHGQLNKRNECAHPSGYFPDLNQALGYIAELFKRIDMLSPAPLPAE